MLLNFTNHSYEGWSQKQQNEAIRLWGDVIDLDFPHINPNFDELDLENLVNEYLVKIVNIKPSAVHIQGEMNFTFQLVYFLMQKNIPCYASTTNRVVEKRGNQIIKKFDFIHFRKYRFLDNLKIVENLNTDIKLTEEQQDAFSKFKDFINPENPNKIFILKGYAGTGKTTLLKFFNEYALKNKFKPIISTPTNKAKNVIIQKLGKKATVSTIHSLIYTFDEVKETKKNAWTGGDGQIYQNYTLKSKKLSIKHIFDLNPLSELDENIFNQIIFMFDEASMISSFETEIIYVSKFGTGSLINDFFKVYGTDMKYIFVGDPCQLSPPNEENYSSALSKEYFEQTLNLPTIEVELTEVKRQDENSGILTIATKLRNKIANKTVENYPKYSYSLNFKDVEICQNMDDLLEVFIDHHSKFGVDNCMMLCYTNSRVNIINKAIKSRLGKSMNIEEGDILVNYSTNSLYKIDNGDRVIVKKIYETIKRAYLSFLKVRVKVIDTLEEIECFIIEDFLMNSAPSLTPTENQNLMIDFDIRMSQNNIKRKTKDWNFALQNDPIVNAVRFKYGYASTIHKSQGSEWDYVFLAFENKDFYTKERDYESSENIAKLMYTGITRSKNKVFINDGYWVEGYNQRTVKVL